MRLRLCSGYGEILASVNARSLTSRDESYFIRGKLIMKCRSRSFKQGSRLLDVDTN